MSDCLQRTALIEYNLDVLRQAQQLVEACATPRLRVQFAESVGPHLRHVIEHYDALLDGLAAGAVDYDARPRDVELERQPVLVLRRLSLLTDRLARLDLSAPQVDLQIVQWAGLEGATRITCSSSLDRELLFVASHAIHHFAVLKPLLAPLDLERLLGAGFGKAPATVRHERERQAGTAAPVQ